MKYITIISLFLMVFNANNILASKPNKVWMGKAILVIKPDKLSAFEEAVAKITEPTRKEIGSIFYEGYQVLDKNGNKTNRFEFHELWASKDAMLIDHKEKSAHMRDFFKTIKIDTKESFIESFEIDGKYVSIVE